ncbi:MAG TPA: class I SAM-dependent methyltransferase [Thermoleophilaceae bacterium]|jgi:SAM-dependent methyltransferase|nr:class I SAM-dependent methyltransferase [Thermoleophilaceae bacterium]
MATREVIRGSAQAQGELWGARARDWAEVQEPAQSGLYGPVLDAAGVGEGTRLLDAGCGSGVATAVAHGRGATVAGIDAALPLIEHARERLAGAEFRVGELEALPYEDSAFDVVTGFNSFQYPADPVRALREARRVTRSGGTVVIVTWGRPEDCEASAYLKALGSLVPPPPPGAPGPFALSEPGALEELAGQAGLTSGTAQELATRWEYPDRETALRGLLSAGPAVKAIDTSGEERVFEAVADSIAPFRTASGGYAIENSWRYLVAGA